MFGGIKAERKSISTLNFVFTGFSLLFPSVCSCAPLFYLPFMAAACVAAMTGSVCQRQRPPVLSRITKAQSTSIFVRFLSSPLAKRPSKSLLTIAWLEKWKEKRWKLWCADVLLCSNYILWSLLSLPAKILLIWHELSFSYLLHVRLFHLLLQQLMDSLITAALTAVRVPDDYSEENSSSCVSLRKESGLPGAGTELRDFQGSSLYRQRASQTTQ